MKKCPVCGANCFDDMEVCYGCMHDFTRALLAHADDAAAFGSVHAEPLFDEEADLASIDEAPQRRFEAPRQEQGAFCKEPVWFSPSRAPRMPGFSPAAAFAPEAESMPIPMVTVVRRDAPQEQEALADASSFEVAAPDASDFVVRVPAGARVLLYAQ